MARRRHGGNPVSLFSFQDIITSVTGIMILITLILGLEVIQRRAGAPDVRTEQLTDELTKAAAEAGRVEQTLEAARRQIDDLRARLSKDESDLLDVARFNPEQLERQLRDMESLNRLLTNEVSASEDQLRQARTSLASLENEDRRRDADRQSLADVTRAAQEKLAELEQLRKNNRVIFNPGGRISKTPWLVEWTAQGAIVARAGKREPPQSFADAKALQTFLLKRSPSTEYFVLLVKPDFIDPFQATRDALEKSGFEVGFDLLAADQTAIDPQLGATAP